jgi:hypothetical protein
MGIDLACAGRSRPCRQGLYFQFREQSLEFVAAGRCMEDAHGMLTRHQCHQSASRLPQPIGIRRNVHSRLNRRMARCHESAGLQLNEAYAASTFRGQAIVITERWYVDTG